MQNVDPKTVRWEWQGFAIPDHMRESLLRYVNEGCPVGEFLTSVIQGDLFEALKRADDKNLRNFPAYGFFFYNYVPSDIYGTREKHAAWITTCREAREEAAKSAGGE